MLVLHHLENSRSQRIAWLLEELGVEYDVRIYQRDPKTILAPPELQAIHPLGKSPIITDGDVTVAESGAIIDYLLDTYGPGNLRPAKESPDYRDFVFWLHYAEGSFMPLMILAIVLRKIDEAPVPFFIKPVARGITGKVRDGYLTQNLTRHLEFIDGRLAAQQWFAGASFSAADIQMSYCLIAASNYVDIKKYQSIHNFIGNISKRPHYQASEGRVGSFALPG